MCWQTVEDGLQFFCNARVWIYWKWGTWEQNGLPWENSVDNQWGRIGRDRKFDFVACCTRIVSEWVVVA